MRFRLTVAGKPDPGFWNNFWKGVRTRIGPLVTHSVARLGIESGDITRPMSIAE
jgi:hypothetical protein